VEGACLFLVTLTVPTKSAKEGSVGGQMKLKSSTTSLKSIRSHLGLENKSSSKAKKNKLSRKEVWCSPLSLGAFVACKC
jgi:hypothetical protein